MDLGTGLNLLGILIGVVFGVAGLFFASKKLISKKTYKNIINVKNLKDSDVKLDNISIGDKNEKELDVDKDAKK